MELFESLEVLLDQVVLIATLLLETTSVLCIVFGFLKTAQLVMVLQRAYRGRPFPFNQVRLSFGAWLALALEFQLGADILGTTVAPTTQELARLGLIAVIRTFLNYFLGKEMETELALERERLEQERLAKEGRS
ncbi:MAG TPA: DUF1622 domain-containing protein [Leptolyngbyaceae cyanobacterium M65_K2018_010]|nr:DUF1622 domain-containing protein [Leptolyngbyaceae cyanobacterium M65_K2018_010]